MGVIEFSAFTLFHIAISLMGIGSGLVVMAGLLNSKRLDGWTILFLITTAATSVTGFLFPFHGVTPGIVVGILSIIVLAIAILARYSLRCHRHSRALFKRLCADRAAVSESAAVQSGGADSIRAAVPGDATGRSVAFCCSWDSRVD